MSSSNAKYPHYFRYVGHLHKIDIYRVCSLWNVNGPREHAVKKILCSGNRGNKDFIRDIDEAIDSLVRAKEMYLEDQAEQAEQAGQSGTRSWAGGGIILVDPETNAHAGNKGILRNYRITKDLSRFWYSWRQPKDADNAKHARTDAKAS